MKLRHLESRRRFRTLSTEYTEVSTAQMISNQFYLGSGGKTYIDLHLLVNTIIHNQAMRQTDAMRLHGVTGDVGEVANI